MMDLIEDVRRNVRQLVREWDLLKGSYKDSGCSYSQCHALLELREHHELSIGELASLLLLDMSTTSRLIKNLQDKALVQIQTKGSDKRQKHLVLTRLGQEKLEKIDASAQIQTVDALETLLPAEKKMVREGLRLYARALEQHRLQKAFRIRPIAEGDSMAVARLIRQVMTEFGAVGKGYSINDPEVERMSEVYRQQGHAFWIIEKDGNILGGGGIGPLPGGKGR